MTKHVRLVCLLLLTTLLAGPTMAVDLGVEERPLYQRIWAAAGDVLAKLGFSPELGPAAAPIDGEPTRFEQEKPVRFRVKIGDVAEPGGEGG